MKQTVTALCLGICALTGPGLAGQLEVTATGFPSDRGAARFVLMRGGAEYAGTRPVFRVHSVPIAGGSASWRVDLAPGTYAVIAHHDANANDALDRPILGIPVEPYGFSGGAWTSLGLPGFDEVSFDVGPAGARQSIQMRTNLLISTAQVSAVALAGLGLLAAGAALASHSREGRRESRACK